MVEMWKGGWGLSSAVSPWLEGPSLLSVFPLIPPTGKRVHCGHWLIYGKDVGYWYPQCPHGLRAPPYCLFTP